MLLEWIFEFILYFQHLILPCRCNPQTVSPFIRFLSEPLDKRNVIHAYMVMSFPVLVLLKRESRTLVTKLSVELGRIEITFQPNFLQLAQLLNYSFGEFQGVPAEVYQRQQLLHMGKVPLYFVHILVGKYRCILSIYSLNLVRSSLCSCSIVSICCTNTSFCLSSADMRC